MTGVRGDSTAMASREGVQSSFAIPTLLKGTNSFRLSFRKSPFEKGGRVHQRRINPPEADKPAKGGQAPESREIQKELLANMALE